MHYRLEMKPGEMIALNTVTGKVEPVGNASTLDQARAIACEHLGVDSVRTLTLARNRLRMIHLHDPRDIVWQE